MSKTPPRYRSTDKLPEFGRGFLYGDDARKVRDTVLNVLSDIRQDGWAAVDRYAQKYDDHSPAEDSLSQSRLESAWENLSEASRDAFRRSQKRIKRYQNAIKPESTVISDGDSGLIGEIARPLETVGCYIPGGLFPLPSTVFMTAWIAEIAGVENIVVSSPPGDDGFPNEKILAALSRLESVDVRVLGGAQAVGAMAFGAGTIPQVDLITGPGNLYVTLAKKEVYGTVGVDLLAGPSEIAVIAEPDVTEAEWVAADLLSQAEHDPHARCYCFSPSEVFLDKVEEQIGDLLNEHPEPEPVNKALDQSGLVRTDSIEEAIELSNELAPEHLELHLNNPTRYARDCRSAGAIFCGPHTPEPIGDYLAGPSHTLPTSGGARYFSPLSIRTFIKFQSLINTDKKTYDRLAEGSKVFADLESLWAHGKSVSVREQRGSKEQ